MTWNFETQLARYGPEGTRPTPSRAEAWQYCKWLATTHYENFTVASLLLPGRLLRHFHAVYAYCRWADDLGDETGGGERALRLLAWWREQLETCYAGKATHPVFVALRDTIRQFGIPRQPFLDLITAFEQDQRVGVYRTYDELVNYCRYSANPVGRLVLYLFESHDEQRGQLADHICTALQLANFWQDVARDVDIQRIYLPAEDRERFGYAEQDLRMKRFTPTFARLMQFEVNRTRDLFFQGYRLVDEVPREVSADVELFIEGGLGILRKIEEAGFNVLDRRPVLSKWEKGRLLAGAMWRRLRQSVA
ncbi:MAG: squalene synthase HpnC [Gemmataceae bacterium]